MLIGDPSILAIESEITHAYERRSFLALGFFAIHVSGRSYGRRSSDSSMLACSHDEVERRIAARGAHTAAFAESDAAKIADSFLSAVYANEQQDNYFGIPRAEFVDLIYSKNIVWAPDGDSAFDDGSCVLQFDVEDQARVIAFKSERCMNVPDSVRDIWLPADHFYKILKDWQGTFIAEWASLPKEPEDPTVR
ncbi:MAG: Imm42 family immunity protein [Candidatus Sulfotelmatobacter sp.]